MSLQILKACLHLYQHTVKKAKGHFLQQLQSTLTCHGLGLGTQDSCVFCVFLCAGDPHGHSAQECRYLFYFLCKVLVVLSMFMLAPGCFGSLEGSWPRKCSRTGGCHNCCTTAASIHWIELNWILSGPHCISSPDSIKYDTFFKILITSLPLSALSHHTWSLLMPCAKWSNIPAD